MKPIDICSLGLEEAKLYNVRKWIERNIEFLSEFLDIPAIQKLALLANEVHVEEAKAVNEGLRIKWNQALDFLGKPRKERFATIPITDPEDDKEWQLLFPPRSKADLGIRRSRLADIYSLSPESCHWVYANVRDLDYISFLLLSIWIYVHPFPDKVKQAILRIRHHGIAVFDGLRDLSNYIKQNGGLDDGTTHLFVEMNNLSGFRNLPFAGFSPLKDAEKLVAKIDKTPGIITYAMRHLDEILPLDIKPKTDPPTFEEYIAQARWSTQGASSEGRVAITIGDKEIVIKARKNQLVDIFTPQELVALYEANKHKQRNTVIIKNETGKVRLAVAADLWTYLRMSWYTELLNGAYLDWSGSVLEEDLVEEASRVENTLMKLMDAWGVPFDFSGFDRQVQLWVQKRFTEHILQAISKTYGIPVDHDLLSSYSDIELTVRVQTANANGEKVLSKDAVLKVKDGLLSGIRWTSLFGNMFNKCVFTGALRLLREVGFNIGLKLLQIKGDDTLVAGKFWDMQTLIVTVLGGGAEAATGKFGILKAQGEFLRVWYDDKLYGYPARTVIGLAQRKPWSSDPWTPDAASSALYDAANTTAIRGCDKALDYARHTIVRWFQRKGLNPVAASTPTELGGRGLLPWDGKVAQVDVEMQQVATLIRKTNWRETLVESWVPEEVKREVAQSQADGTLTQDDIRKVNEELRSAVKFGKSRSGRTVKPKVNLGTFLSKSMDILMRTRGMTADAAIQHIRESTSVTKFGAHKQIVAHWQLVRKVSDHTGERPITILSREYSPERIDLGWLESTMKLRRGEALDWLAGSVPGWKFDKLSPKLNSVAQALFELEVMNIRSYGYDVRPIELVPSVGKSIVATLLTLPWVERVYSF